jgi:CubicO group peptidase (beta-lactamase class C family)
VLILRDEGKLSLDDPATGTLPELAALRYPTRDSRPITIRDLLTHSSGLPQFGRFSHSRPGHEVTESELFSDLAHLEMPYAPGTRYFYSNFGAALLGPLVARVSGMPYRDFVTQRILAPLGMRSSVWADTDVPKGRLATGYVPGTAGLSRQAPWRLGAMEAAGGLFMSLRDLARWAAFQLAAYPPRNDPDPGPLRRSSVREGHGGQRRIGLAILAHEPTATRPSIVTARAGGVGLAWHVFES